jgi:hypothetical protein
VVLNKLQTVGKQAKVCAVEESDWINGYETLNFFTCRELEDKSRD